MESLDQEMFFFPGEPEPYPCTGYQIYVDWNKTNVKLIILLYFFRT